MINYHTIVDKKAAVKKVDKKNAVAKANKAAKAVKKGVRAITKKVRTTPHFHRPHTLRLPRQPRYALRSIPKANPLDSFTIVKAPVFTDSSMKEIESNNTLTFVVDPRANKIQIANAIKALYNVDVVRVNTLIRYVTIFQHHITF